MILSKLSWRWHLTHSNKEAMVHHGKQMYKGFLVTWLLSIRFQQRWVHYHPIQHDTFHSQMNLWIALILDVTSGGCPLVSVPSYEVCFNCNNQLNFQVLIFTFNLQSTLAQYLGFCDSTLLFYCNSWKYVCYLHFHNDKDSSDTLEPVGG